MGVESHEIGTDARKEVPHCFIKALPPSDPNAKVSEQYKTV